MGKSRNLADLLDTNGKVAPAKLSTGAPTWDGSGNLTATGNVTAYSDERLKTDWESLASNFVEQVACVRAGTYTRTDTGERQAGTSAQDWQRILPEVVSDGEYLSLAYGNAALVAVVALARRVIALEGRIAMLEQRA